MVYIFLLFTLYSPPSSSGLYLSLSAISSGDANSVTQEEEKNYDNYKVRVVLFIQFFFNLKICGVIKISARLIIGR